MPSRRPILATLLAPIPNTPGVYLFYGTQDELLYVGKSKSLKTRVRAHFRDRSERWMTSRIRRIETHDTAGELGALLLESRLIKEMKPMYNVAQRQRRRIVIAERRVAPEGYTALALRAVDGVDSRRSGEILGVFKHTTQAKEFMDAACKERMLCPVLMGLEGARRQAPNAQRSGATNPRDSSIVYRQSSITSRRPCFSYHLGRCLGACVGEEPPETYNARVETAFEERRIVAWPYGGGLVIGERGPGNREEIFLVDNWVLVGSLTKQGDSLAPFVPTSHRFDYDTYKILYTFVAKPSGGQVLRVPSAAEWKRLLKAAGGQIKVRQD